MLRGRKTGERGFDAVQQEIRKRAGCYSRCRGLARE